MPKYGTTENAGSGWQILPGDVADTDQAVAKATWNKTANVWKIYWQRADLKWHRYAPDPEVKTVEKFLAVVDRDEFGCFFG